MLLQLGSFDRKNKQWCERMTLLSCIQTLRYFWSIYVFISLLLRAKPMMLLLKKTFLYFNVSFLPDTQSSHGHEET